MNPIYRLLNLLLTLYTYGLIAYILLSWTSGSEMHRARIWLGQFYEPILRPLQRTFRPIRVGGALIDLSPIIVFILIFFARLIIRELFHAPI